MRRATSATLAGWAVVFGILGGRIYHVLTDPELYFKHGEDAVNALKIWDGGLGIPGAIALGTVGAWIGCRRHDMKLSSIRRRRRARRGLRPGHRPLGQLVQQRALRPATTLPWKLEIHQIDVTSRQARA